MSADNTIIVLETQGEFRVGHFQAADNLWFTWINPFKLPESDSADKDKIGEQSVISARVFEYFYHIDPIPNGLLNMGAKEKALKQAGELYDEMGYVEYGIQLLKLDKTFGQIALEASEQVKEEISHVSKSNTITLENKAVFLDELETTLKEIHGWLAVHG